MTLQYITVKKLFGELDHQIPIHSDAGLTLLHGPNGVGKTSILRAIDSLFNHRFSRLRSMPIQELEVGFSDGDLLRVTWATVEDPEKISDGSPERREISFELHTESGETEGPWTFERVTPRDLEVPLSAIEDIVPNLTRIDRAEWFDASTNRTLDLDDVLYSYNLPWSSGKRQSPSWLIEKLSQNPVYLIEANRLMVASEASGGRSRRVSFPRLTVSLYKDDLAGEIQSRLADYAEYSQSLDSTFPDRLLSKRYDKAPVTDEEVRRRYAEQAEKRRNYVKIGLLDAGDELQLPKNLDDRALGVLDTYLDDIDKKLNKLEDIANRLELFLDIVNQKFRRVRIEVNKEKGLTARARKKPDMEIALDSLSSGEQQEIVIAYGLLFREQAGTLVLVDEPELSLHVSWQLDFIPDLLRIAQVANLDFLAATHSPQIVNDRWDLTVALSDGV
ncbi:AAA family ATPase [Streptomyces roseolus]|uniref:AAA family ATPase n=1 Tax=Streptomyces roseolus TaxID=67358 RepID=UPI0037963D88